MLIELLREVSEWDPSWAMFALLEILADYFSAKVQVLWNFVTSNVRPFKKKWIKIKDTRDRSRNHVSFAWETISDYDLKWKFRFPVSHIEA